MPKPMCMPSAPHHKLWIGWLVLIAGILFLIQDYAPASMSWWKVSVWPTAIFILAGLAMIAKCCKK